MRKYQFELMSGLSPQSQQECCSFSGFDYTVNKDIAEEFKEESQTQKNTGKMEEINLAITI